MSVLLFPPPSLDSPRVLTALGAVAVAEVAEAWLGRPATIKWPNDVRVGGRKLAGILVERGAGCVIGIGLNANLGHDDLPPPLRPTATSLSLELGAAVDRSELVRDLIRGLDRFYNAAIADAGAALDGAWSARLEAIGRRVRVETPTGALTGRLVAASLARGVMLCDDMGRAIPLAPETVLDLRIDGSEAVPGGGDRPVGAKSPVSSLAAPGEDC
jgi:BirA family biotin operon repressor/biotin-[acetyl-CoA-carboxylase] ligase